MAPKRRRTQTKASVIYDSPSDINLDWFTTHDNECNRGSGIVEHYDRKEQLLNEIIPLMKEAELAKLMSASERTKRFKDKTAGEEIRKAALLTRLDVNTCQDPGDDKSKQDK
ncbi:unnamed protein product [Allacma fusca]|uniref:Uncharacterized protein n=1 Tax=Allacma fusca TaxID=39272 RepID=A0A8J2L293_9HEXA|nr:unnamed protein product [Allacma fusca]